MQASGVIMLNLYNKIAEQVSDAFRHQPALRLGERNHYIRSYCTKATICCRAASCFGCGWLEMLILAAEEGAIGELRIHESQKPLTDAALFALI